MEKEEKTFSDILKKLKENEFVDEDEIDDVIEGFSWTIPGWPGIPDSYTKACLVCCKTRCFMCDTRCNECHCTVTKWPGIPGFPPIGINVPDMPSGDTIFNNIKNDITNNVINPMKKILVDAIDNMKKGVVDMINTVTAEIKNAINEITDGFNQAIQKITDWFQQLGKQMNSVFGQIAVFFNDLGNRFTQMGKGLGDIFTGLLVEGPEGLGKGLYKGFADIGTLFFWTSEFVFSHIICGVQYMQNLHKCFLYYTLDILGKIWYTPIYFINWIAYEWFDKDLVPGQEKIWNMIYAMDDDFNASFGFHFARYPKNIHDMCYNCKRLKVLALKDKSRQINYDFNTNIPELLNKGNKKMQSGGDKFKGAFL
jgi:hypothetical protein